MSGRISGEEANGPPNAATAVALDRPFGPGDLRDLRRAAAALAAKWGAVPDQVDALKLIVGELAANAIRHASGRGRLRMWRRGEQIHCEVSDAGPGFRDPERVGLQRPAPMSLGGRGIWLVRALADEVTIGGGPVGATVTAQIRLGAPVSTLWKQHPGPFRLSRPPGEPLATEHRPVPGVRPPPASEEPRP